MRKAVFGLFAGLSVAVMSVQGGSLSALAAEKATPVPTASETTSGQKASETSSGQKASETPGTYQLLFREGVLDKVAKDAVLDYAIHRNGWSAPQQQGIAPEASKFDGSLALTTGADDSVVLTLKQGERKSSAGTFPRSVGNPVIMYFLESVLRDMANQAGGSPFYIRNRIKAALLEAAEVKPVSVTLDGRDIQAQQVTIHPFAKDQARDRMFGFADLKVVAILSEEVPGWYYSLSAEAPRTVGGKETGYSNVLTLDRETL
ncbi:hypothetical protein [Rhodospirillum sp. A1_3_36]|uniref:hypothetical protein n=1 Tax=Rhodospirillum sp. A1_3_36 TaxID=3391666 RepID=UPI0039A63C81